MNDPFAGPSSGVREPGVGGSGPIDIAARDESHRLIEENLEYVKALAHQMHHTIHGSVEFDELVAMGNQGLVKAARDFDPLRGAAFRTYAYYKIRGAMFEGLRVMSWSRRSRAALRDEEARDSAAQEFVGSAEAGESSDGQIAKLEGDFLRGIRRLAVIRLVGEFHDGEHTPEDRTDPSEEVERREMGRKLTTAIQKLAPEDRDLITHLYVDCKSMTDCAKELGVHKSTITRRHAEVVESLRRLIVAAGDDAEPPG
jgi:RNA polymerase sigma factor FliA